MRSDVLSLFSQYTRRPGTPLPWTLCSVGPHLTDAASYSETLDVSHASSSLSLPPEHSSLYLTSIHWENDPLVLAVTPEWVSFLQARRPVSHSLNCASQMLHHGSIKRILRCRQKYGLLSTSYSAISHPIHLKSSLISPSLTEKGKRRVAFMLPSLP